MDSGTLLATGLTTTAVVSKVQGLTWWITVGLWVMWAAIAVLYHDEINFRSIVTYIVSGAIASLTGTNIIIDKFFSDSENIIPLSIWIAFILWILGHIVFYTIIENKANLKNKLSSKLFDNDKENVNK